MSIEKLEDGKWFVDVEPVKGKRFRRKFKTKAEALRFESVCRSKTIVEVDWSPKKKDSRKLSEIINVWFDVHGNNLRDGSKRLAKLSALAKQLGDPVAAKLEPQAYSQYRRARLDAGLSQKTMNNELGYLKGVYNELKALDVIDYENPIRSVKPLSIRERELSFLSQDQINELLDSIRSDSINPHLEPIVLICLATGARWSEAHSVKPSSIQKNVITFSATKNGKVRAVPVADSLIVYLKSHWSKFGAFTCSLSSFRRALVRTSIQLPKGQSAHALRHTFASHFVMNGGNILTLQKILGHSTVVMTMRYAHLSPDHLQDAIKLNPVKELLFSH
ncbi:MAG TPA: tyrosine-type recombinase/integrase [Cellvibrio sp.]